jgi:hypothetical protein
MALGGSTPSRAARALTRPRRDDAGNRQGIGTMFAQAISGLSAGPVGSAWTL